MVDLRVRKLVVACRWKSGPGSCQEARLQAPSTEGDAIDEVWSQSKCVALGDTCTQITHQGAAEKATLAARFPRRRLHAPWLMPQRGDSSRVGQSQHLSDDVAEVLHGPDLMIGRLAQQRLDRAQIIQDALQVAW